MKAKIFVVYLFGSLSWILILVGINSVYAKTYTCNGPLIIINDTATCNGVDISKSSPESKCISNEKSVCGYEIVTVHANGGGAVSSCTKDVAPESYIDDSSAVCGNATVGPLVKILNGSIVSGVVELDGNTEIIKSNVQGTMYIIDSKVEMSQIAGAGQIYYSEIATTLKSGSGDIEESKISSSNISGSGAVISSDLRNINKSGSGEIIGATLKDQIISGSQDIRGNK